MLKPQKLRYNAVFFLFSMVHLGSIEIDIKSTTPNFKHLNTYVSPLCESLCSYSICRLLNENSTSVVDILVRFILWVVLV